MKQIQKLIADLRNTNPIIELLKKMISNNLIPYDSVHELILHRISQRRVRRMYCRVAFFCLNITRLATMVFSTDYRIKFFILEYLKYETNQRAFLFAVCLVVACPSLMYLVSILILTNKSKPFEGFDVLIKLDQHMCDNNLQEFVRFSLALNSFVRAYYILVLTVLVALLGYILWDFWQAYFDMITPILVIRFVIFNSALLVHVSMMLMFAIYWLHLYMIMIVFLNFQYNQVLHKFRRLINYSIRIRLIDSIAMLMLGEVTQVNTRLMRFAIQMRLFLGIFYYQAILATDALFFVILDWRTNAFLRLVSLTVFAFTMSVLVIALTIFARVNLKSRSMISLLETFIYRHYTSKRLKLKALEIYAMLRFNRVGINCADVFIFTRHTNLRTMISFVLNIFLIVNLFQNYFFKHSQ